MKNKLFTTVCFILSIATITLFFTGCKIDPCKNVTCKNGGTTAASGKKCTCNCAAGYEGEFCDAKTCTTAGNSVNIGSTGGGSHYLTLGAGLTGGGGNCNGQGNCPPTHEDRIEFNNTNLNFSMQNGCTTCGYTGCAILDAGPQTCLDFSYSGTPSAQIVAYVNGHGYVGSFGDGRTVKFITGTYSQGSVRITYVFQ